MKVRRLSLWAGGLAVGVAALAIHRTQAAQRTRTIGEPSGTSRPARALEGTVLGGGAPIVASTVTLWSAGVCGGNGLTVFYGMARPVRTPQIGPPRAP